MTKTLRLNDFQLVLLAGAAGRENGSLIPLPENCRQDTARIDKAITSLRRRRLVEEMAVTDKTLAWRTHGESMIGLFITPAGRDAIGAGGDEPAGCKDAPPPAGGRPASKIAQVMALLQRKEGATLKELVAITGWLPHTTRAALTGLRKKGHVIAKGKREHVTCYTIAAEA